MTFTWHRMMMSCWMQFTEWTKEKSIIYTKHRSFFIHTFSLTIERISKICYALCWKGFRTLFHFSLCTEWKTWLLSIQWRTMISRFISIVLSSYSSWKYACQTSLFRRHVCYTFAVTHTHLSDLTKFTCSHSKLKLLQTMSMQQSSTC